MVLEHRENNLGVNFVSLQSVSLFGSFFITQTQNLCCFLIIFFFQVLTLVSFSMFLPICDLAPMTTLPILIPFETTRFSQGFTEYVKG